MSKPTIGGQLDLAALAALSEDDKGRMRHFQVLGREQQAQAVRRLAATRMSDHGIAAVTRLSVEQVRRVLAEHPRPDEIHPC